MQAAKNTRGLNWDSFLDIVSAEKGNSKVLDTKLKEDVKDAYNVLFKTEPRLEEKESS